MSTLIQVGVLTMTPAQFRRALAEDLTVSQALRMIEQDKRKYSALISVPLVSDTEEEANHD